MVTRSRCHKLPLPPSLSPQSLWSGHCRCVLPGLASPRLLACTPSDKGIAASAPLRPGLIDNHPAFCANPVKIQLVTLADSGGFEPKDRPPRMSGELDGAAFYCGTSITPRSPQI